MESQKIPILLYFIASFLGAFGQYFYKLGSKKLGTISLLQNWHLFAGVACFCVVMILFVAGFKLGGRMGVVYPVYATTFIWGLLIAKYLENEVILLSQLIGVGFIVAGVITITVFSTAKGS